MRGPDVPVRELGAEHPRGADQRDRGDFGDFDARESLPNLENTDPRWQLTGTVRRHIYQTCIHSPSFFSPSAFCFL